MSTVLIVDDTDPAITYSGSWVVLRTQTGEYNATVHQSGASGGHLSYTFTGIGIDVYGTLDEPGAHGPPSASFSIDGQTPTAFNSTNSIFVNSPGAITAWVQLYQSPRLAKGTHTLSVLAGTPANAAALLYIDFFTIDTGSDSVSGNIIVDDRDSAIAYTGNWGDQGSLWEYDITTKEAPDQVGGTAAFSFNGTSITIYGTTTFSTGPNTTAAINFAIDGGPGSQFNAPQNAGIIEHSVLFHVEGLSNTQEHGIVMTSLNTNTWFLDCLVYTTHNSSIAGGGSSITEPETGGSGGGAGGPKVGAIAGGVVAGVVALLAIAGIIFVLLRRRRIKPGDEVKGQSAGVGVGSNLDTLVEPFTVPVTGADVHPDRPSNKRHDVGGSRPELTSGSTGDRIGQALLDPTPSTSHLGGTSSAYSSVPPTMSQYSDGGSHDMLSPAAAGPGPGHSHYPGNPRFDPGAGEGVASMHQRDGRQDYDQATGQPLGQKAEFTGGQVASQVTPAVTPHRGPRPPPTSVATIEEDSGLRIPTRAPPVYTSD